MDTTNTKTGVAVDLKTEQVSSHFLKTPLSFLQKQTEQTARNSVDYMFRTQKADFHWTEELESNSTITSEYVYLCKILAQKDSKFENNLLKKREAIIQYFFNQQKPDGSWGIAYNHTGDISTTAEAYLALRMLEVNQNDSRMLRAEDYILKCGGLAKVRIFTRINFALFGLFPWEAVPVIPPEFILLPPKSPVNIYSLSSWARGTMVPLFMIFHHKPAYALFGNDFLDHLWIDPRNKIVPYGPSFTEVFANDGASWRLLFSSSDTFLKLYERFKPAFLRQLAVKKCEEWVLERQEKSGDWAGIFPPMCNGVLALFLNDFEKHRTAIELGMKAIENFSFEDTSGYRIQACVSPVWDTVLGMIGIIDCGHDPADLRLINARHWVAKKQLLVDYGDWKIYNPNGTAGGWSFEYENSWYPDIDDTAAVIIALLKQDPHSKNSHTIQCAVEWIVSMQNRDGGWAAFDLNNDKLFLNQMPFSDMDSLCDPSSPDVTGRVLEAFGLLGEVQYSPGLKNACRRGIEYLRKTQEQQGSWFGRWGVNYIYGTSNVLCSLQRQKIPATDAMIQKALNWLVSVQNSDGGWGEGLETYKDKSKMGIGASTASQTAWALMGLLAYLPSENASIQNGIRWLNERQTSSGTWDEEEFTGTGFPNYFYLRYHMYRHYFPMMAIGRFISKIHQSQ